MLIWNLCRIQFLESSPYEGSSEVQGKDGNRVLRIVTFDF